MSNRFLVRALVSILLMGVAGTGFYLTLDLTDRRSNITLRSVLPDTQRAEVLATLQQSDIDLTSLEEVKTKLTEIDWIHRVLSLIHI